LRQSPSGACYNDLTGFSTVRHIHGGSKNFTYSFWQTTFQAPQMEAQLRKAWITNAEDTYRINAVWMGSDA